MQSILAHVYSTSLLICVNVFYFQKVPYEMSDYMWWLRADVDSWKSSAHELTFVEGPLDQWTDEVCILYSTCINFG